MHTGIGYVCHTSDAFMGLQRHVGPDYFNLFHALMGIPGPEKKHLAFL